MLKDILKCIEHGRLEAEQKMIYRNEAKQNTPSKNTGLMCDCKCILWGKHVTNRFHTHVPRLLHACVYSMFTAYADWCVCLFVSLSSGARVVSYIILLLSCRNCLDSHLARVCHPFVIWIEGPWLLGPRDSSKINWLEMTSARICHRSARRYHKWNHKP